MSGDPLGMETRASNLYLYLSGNPLRWHDPFGLATEQEAQETIRRVKEEKWYQDLQKQFGNKCKMPDIVPAKGNMNSEDQVAGQYSDKDKVVYVFYDSGTVKDIERTIIHELVHAYDYCQGLYNTKVDRNATGACGELRAYRFSGQCNTPEGSGGYLKKGESPADCLLRKAVDSIRKSVEKTIYEPEEFACCVWDTCVCDSRIPGSGPYNMTNPPGLPKKPNGCNGKEGFCDQIVGPNGKKNLQNWF
jgi:hypothetical protein